MRICHLPEVRASLLRSCHDAEVKATFAEVRTFLQWSDLFSEVMSHDLSAEIRECLLKPEIMRKKVFSLILKKAIGGREDMSFLQFSVGPCMLSTVQCTLKITDNEKVGERGVWKVANVRYWSRTVVKDTLLFSNQSAPLKNMFGMLLEP
jgi:hypothetical protein